MPYDSRLKRIKKPEAQKTAAKTRKKRRKTITATIVAESGRNARQEFKRSFGYWAVLSLAIGSIVGTTLFLGAGIGARYSGNLTLLAWVLVSAFAIYVAACFGELTSTFPKAGGAYEFAKQAYGRFFSFMIGWMAWLVGSIAVVVMVVGATSFLFPNNSDFSQFLISVGIISAMNAVAYLGVQASSLMLIGFAIAMVAVPLAIIIKGFPAISWQNFTPFLTHPLYTVMITSFFIVESFFGWESATYLAEETRNPRKTIPKALMHASVIIALLGFLLMLVLFGTVNWQQLSIKETPLADVAAMILSEKMAAALAFGVFLALVGSAASGIVALPRLILAMARDRLFPGQFMRIHPRFSTPHNAILFQAVSLVTLLLLGFANYETLLSMLIPTSALMYITLLLAVPILRKKYPNIERPFRVPFAKLGIAVAILFLVAAIALWALNVQNSERLLELSIYLIAMGLPLYLLVELYYDPKMITQVNDLLAYLTLFTEKFTFSGRMKKEIFAFLGDLKNKTVLEFGCGVGTLTLELAKRVGLKGKVYAIHFSKNHLKITSKRVDDLKWGTDMPIGIVEVMHDDELFRRVHPDVTYADAIVSAGMLSYVQDMKKVLKEMWAILPAGGKVCFTDYTDFFHILPNVEWVSSEASIEQLFRSAGFAVRVAKTKGFLWNRIFLYGIKTKEKETVSFI
ncbi:amino acid permease [Candidatus Woesearchaeota archaeon]|nr:amino acid permease [Candidatus Woesearchaeota archaeon]